MSNLKRMTVLMLVLAIAFSLFACSGEYQQGIVGGGTIGGGGDGNDGGGSFTPPTMNDDPTDDFTVTLMADGRAYRPRMDMYAHWNDGFSIHTAKFNEFGIAKIDGLDGDYRVTLSDVPNEYTYNPNAHVATNETRAITVDLYTLNRLGGNGTGIYDCYTFKKTGVYAATIKSADDVIYFQYAPETSGTYSIESWADTTADNVNPYVDVYGGNTQFKYLLRTVNDGGTVGSYTLNFMYSVQIAKENISSGGQATYTFAIKADTKNNSYPVSITFAVKRNGEFELNAPGTIKGMAIPEFDFSDFDKSKHEYDKSEYSIVNPEYRLNGSSNVYVMDQKKFKVWEKDAGGDGFYHVYDKDKYPETNGYGPILYAYITEPTRFIDKAFSKLDYDANGNILFTNLKVNGLDYKHFIEGYTALSTPGAFNGSSYYCVTGCPCHKGESTGWACTNECTNCDISCKRCPEELIGHEGYQAYANSDGLVPVTEELREFLLAYCLKEQFFYDGLGSIEKNPVNGIYYQSVGDSGWLFACAYYEKN